MQQRIKQILFIMSLNLLCASAIYAQKANVENAEVNLSTPQTYDFMRYGNAPVNFNTGEINLSIPIYTYKDNDFEIPIYTGYNSSGFLPNKRDGIVGYNWYLNAGGAITRQVNGVPDEIDRDFSFSGSIVRGMYAGYKSNPNSDLAKKSADDIFNFVNYTTKNMIYNIDGCEVEPDKFSISAPDLKGSFIIQNNGVVRCLDNAALKVDITGLTVYHEADQSMIQQSEIKIINENGYTYYFGGDLNFLEINNTVAYYDNSNIVQLKNPVINSWHLKKIVAPNGRTVNYSYKQMSTNSYGIYGNENFFQLSISKIQDYATSRSCGTFSWMGWLCSGTFSYDPTIKSYHTIKTVYLEKIVVDNTSIEFSYTPKSFKFYDDTKIEGQSSLRDCNTNTLQLDEIVVKFNGSLIANQKYTFNYITGSNGRRNFLQAIRREGENSYLFEYNNILTLPGAETNGIDYWGFWNGGTSENSSLLPQIVEDPVTGDFYYVSENNPREPQQAYCEFGLLQKVTYPTGGYTTFKYQGHDYSKRLERKSASQFLPSLTDINGKAGGARIYQVIDNDVNNGQMVREYKYVNDYNLDGTTSSGILMDYPRYQSTIKIRASGVEYDAKHVQNNSFNTNYYPGENFIQYGEVTEIQKKLPTSTSKAETNGFTTYKYTTYATNPDDAGYNALKVWETLYDPTNPNLVIKSRFKINDHSFERGKLKQVSKYKYDSGTQNFILVVDEKTDYSVVRNASNYYWVGVTNPYQHAQAYKIYSYSYLPSKIETTSYDTKAENFVTQVEYFSYNLYNQRTQDIISQSDGYRRVSEYCYPLDFPLATAPSEIKSLINQNQISPVIAKLSYLEKGSSKKLTGVEYSKYAVFSNAIIKPQIIYKNKSLDQSSYLGLIPTDGDISKLYPLNPVISYNYDIKGNLIQHQKDGNINTSYIWAYNPTYPVIKAENIDNTTLNTVVTSIQSDFQTFMTSTIKGCTTATQKTSWKDFNTALRNNASLKKSMITTFTYAPLIGMTSQTDPNGITTYYEYDSFGRLKFIKDDKGNMLKKYEYHFKE